MVRRRAAGRGVLSAQQALDTGPPVVEFFEKPWRHYKVDGVKVPSVTQVIKNTTDKSGALTGWAQRETVNALDTLHAQYGADDGIFRDPERLEAAILAYGRELNAQAFVELYESQQTTLPWGRPWDLLRLVKQSEESINAKMKAAADRGLAIHTALEEWGDGKPLDPDAHPDEYRGYFVGLAKWLVQFRPTFLGSEVVVGSRRHRFGGRLDHHLRIEHPDYGRVLVDLKTNRRGQVYPVEHFTQVEAYELAAVECGHEPTAVRAVLAIGEEGGVDFRRNTGATGDDFLAALEWFNRQKRIEREAKKAAK